MGSDYRIQTSFSAVTPKPDYGAFRSKDPGQDLSGSLQGAGGVGGLLMIEIDGTNSFPCFDGNGNVMALVKGADGSLVGEYEYGPFGETLKADGQNANANPLRFSTKYTDRETGLIEYGLRYYHPDTGRWLSRDPIGELGGLGLYASCGNRHTMHIDVLGAADSSSTKVEYYEPNNFWVGVAFAAKEGSYLDPRKSIVGGEDCHTRSLGLVFTCRCGWLDIAHIRHAMDRTLKFYIAISENPVKGAKLEGLEYGMYIPPPLLKDVPQGQWPALAAYLAEEEGKAHERQDMLLGGLTGIHISTYTAEDLPSNFVGAMIAKSQVASFAPRPTRAQWQSAMNRELEKVIKECVPVSEKDASNVWAKYSKQRGGVLYDQEGKQRMNTSRKPWIVGCEECKGVDQTPPSWFNMTSWFGSE